MQPELDWKQHSEAAHAAAERRDLLEAEQEQRLALAAAELFGEDDPRLADTLQALIELGDRLRRPAEVIEPLARRLLALSEARHGPESPDVVPPLTRLASAVRSAHRFEEAEALYRRALRIQEAHSGPDSPSVGWALHGVGVMLWAQRRYDDAEAEFIRALRLFETADDDQRSESARAAVLECLWMMYRTAERPAAAERVLIQALELAQARGEDELHLGRLHGELGHAFAAQGKHDLGERAYAEAVQLHQRWFRRITRAARFQKPSARRSRSRLRAAGARFTAWFRSERAASLRALGREAEARRQDVLAQRAVRYADALDGGRD